MWPAGPDRAGHGPIEHTRKREVIKTADWVIDLGPEGGDKGGEIVAEGTPEQVAREARSYTGTYLKPLLTKSAHAERSRGTPSSEAETPSKRRIREAAE